MEYSLDTNLYNNRFVKSDVLTNMSRYFVIVLKQIFDYISAFIIFYIRYRQIRTHYEGAGRTKLLKYNTVTFVMGITAALGISLVGNFQVQIFPLLITYYKSK